MKYIGMPMGMWMLFAGSFRRQLTAVFGYDASPARAIAKAAKPRYRAIICDLPEFERGDRFQMNLVNCAMIGAFILSMPERPRIGSDAASAAVEAYQNDMLAAILPMYLPLALLLGLPFGLLLAGKTRYPRRMLVFRPVTWSILLVVIPDIAQAMQLPVATWMSVMSQSSTNSAIVIWCIAAAIYEKKHP